MAAQKKSQIASERDEEARDLWRWLASHFDARRLVIVDESGVHTSMTRLYAWAPRGQRGPTAGFPGIMVRTLLAHCCDHHRRRPGRVGGYRGSHGCGDLRRLRGGFLAPSQKEGQVVVLDKLGAHRTQRGSECSLRLGVAQLLFLPF